MKEPEGMTPNKGVKNTMDFKPDEVVDALRLASEHERSLEVMVIPWLH